MTIVKSVGKNTLGQGEKMNVAMKSYEMSTHDLSKRRRTTMSPGLLTPLYHTIGLPGDKFEIDLNASVLTLPTNGPLFGSFKFQIDLFKADLRLYQSLMQNNELDQGMNMAEVTLPQLILKAKNQWPHDTVDSNSQTNPSSILARLGIRGIGISQAATPEISQRAFNATSYLAYWDIFKNFYANRQEKKAYVVHNVPAVNFTGEITAVSVTAVGFIPVDPIPPLPGVGIVIDYGAKMKISFATGTNLSERPVEYTEVLFVGQQTGEEGEWMNPMEIFAEKFQTDSGGFAEWNLQGVRPGMYGGIRALRYVANNELPILPPNLVEFDLANLDIMRRNILQSETGVILDGNSIAPYGLPLKINEDLKTSAIGTQEGLATKTYQSDIFNNWIRTEFVEQTSTQTAVSTATGSFTMDMLNLAQKLYDLQNRISISGGSIDDWLETVWTAGKNDNVTTPEYMGGMSREIEFEEVISTAETSANGLRTPLGQLGGRGVTRRERNGGRIRIVVGTQPCVIMAIVSITPRIGYSQGNDWETLLRTMDDLHKPALDGIGYEDVITDQFDWRDSEDWGLAEPVLKSIGKRPAWMNYMTAYDQICGNFAIDTNQQFMVLDRRYEYTSQGFKGTKDKTTYIDPQKYNYAFAETTLDAQNFWVQIGFDVKARRKISSKQIPNL